MLVNDLNNLVNEGDDIATRVVVANGLLLTIAHHGRMFFYRDGEVSQFAFEDGRLFFDDCSGKRLSFSRIGSISKGFTNGGTLRHLIEQLAQYIHTGERLARSHFFWDGAYNDDLWGYGDTMRVVQDYALHAGIVNDKDDRPVVTNSLHQAVLMVIDHIQQHENKNGPRSWKTICQAVKGLLIVAELDFRVEELEKAFNELNKDGES